LKEEERKDEVTKINEERSSGEIPIHPLHYLSPSFLSIIFLITSLPPSSQSSSPPLHPSFLSIRHLIDRGIK
jgi:hypothetical protein